MKARDLWEPAHLLDAGLKPADMEDFTPRELQRLEEEMQRRALVEQELREAVGG